MPIIRHTPKEGYTPIPNQTIRDKRLTGRDIGILVYMLSLPDGWNFSIKGLVTVLPNDGRDGISVSLQRLEKAGYLRRTRARNTSGTISGCEWTISDLPLVSPQTEKPDMVLPQTDFPDADLPDTVNPTQIKELRKENKKRICTHFSKPSLSDVAAFAAESGWPDFDAAYFIDYYESIGWKVGKTPMKDWKATARNWQRRNKPKEPEPDYYAGTGWSPNGRIQD